MNTLFEKNTTFGGIIYQSDFDTSYCGGTVASRILSDQRFDEQCKKNRELKEQLRAARLEQEA